MVQFLTLRAGWLVTPQMRSFPSEAGARFLEGATGNSPETDYRPFNQIVLKIERCGFSRKQTFDAVDLTGQFDNCSCFINVHAKIYSYFGKSDYV